MDSLAEMEDDAIDIEVELDEWLTKTAAEQGVDRDQLRALEYETWERWRANPNPDDFHFLWNSHQPLIARAPGVARIIATSNLPPAAIKSRVLRNYIQALEKYDPSKGTQLSSYIMGTAGNHLSRYVNDYTNIGKIQEGRLGLIPLMQHSEADLRQELGRPPSDAELSERMKVDMVHFPQIRLDRVTPTAVSTLRTELRPDLMQESGEGAPTYQESKLERQAVFLHGSLNPEQQLVLEHTYPGFGKPIIHDPEALGKELTLSPQKIRAIKNQIAKKLGHYYPEVKDE